MKIPITTRSADRLKKIMEGLYGLYQTKNFLVMLTWQHTNSRKFGDCLQNLYVVASLKGILEILPMS